MISIIDIWKNLNVSTVLILPLYNDMTINIKSKKNRDVEFTFTQLAFEYGFIRAFLYYKDKDYSENYLYLLFDAELVNQDKRLTNSSYYSLNDLIVDSENFMDAENLGEYVLYKFAIPSEFKKDINLITKSSYSHVSKEYSDAIKITHKKAPSTDNEFGLFLVSWNLGFAIVDKFTQLREEIETKLGIVLDGTEEYYSKFDVKKETFDPLDMHNYDTQRALFYSKPASFRKV